MAEKKVLQLNVFMDKSPYKDGGNSTAFTHKHNVHQHQYSQSKARPRKSDPDFDPLMLSKADLNTIKSYLDKVEQRYIGFDSGHSDDCPMATDALPLEERPRKQPSLRSSDS
jgi:hypothetical protein